MWVGEVQFLHKDKLKSEIFSENISLLSKMFSSVNLKDGMGIKDKRNCILWGFTEKSDF